MIVTCGLLVTELQGISNLMHLASLTWTGLPVTSPWSSRLFDLWLCARLMPLDQIAGYQNKNNKQTNKQHA
jgi:hypothetical protein